MRSEIQRCPFCDEPDWEACSHKLLEWATVERGHEHGPLRPELEKTVKTLHVLARRAHEQGVLPKEPRAIRLIPRILSAPEFAEDSEHQSDAEVIPRGFDLVVDEISAWPGVRVSDPTDSNSPVCMWSANPTQVFESLVQWRTRLEVEATHEELQQADSLLEFFREGVRTYLRAETGGRAAISADEEIERRISNCRSSQSFATDLMGMAKDLGFVLEDYVPDGMATFLLVPDELLEARGEFLLDLYTDWIAKNESGALPHPGQYSGPREADATMERQRLISDFSQFAKDWRDQLLSTLIDDLKRQSDSL